MFAVSALFVQFEWTWTCFGWQFANKRFHGRLVQFQQNTFEFVDDFDATVPICFSNAGIVIAFG